MAEQTTGTSSGPDQRGVEAAGTPARRLLGSANGIRRAVLGTAVVNMGVTVVAATAGVIIARSLGPDGRGDYAALMAWFGLILIVGELGQPAATTYFVARHPDRAADYTATSRRIILLLGPLLTLFGLLGASVLSDGRDGLTAAYQVVFLCCVPSFLGASFSFALQGRSIPLWNLMRASQPVAFLLAVVVAALLDQLTLMAVAVLFSGTVTAQAVLAYALARRIGLAGGRGHRELMGPMAKYGASQLASTAPQTLNGRLDQMVLSQSAKPADLGHYAVAVTVTGLAVPVVSALGNVAFPRLAARAHDEEAAARLVRRAIVASLVLSVLVVGGLTLTAHWTVPLLFGEESSDSVPLVWLLAAGGVFLAGVQVMSDLLRGRGRPLAVAKAQGVGVVVTFVGLVIAIPVWGAAGAAVVSSACYALTWALLLLALRRAGSTFVDPGVLEDSLAVAGGAEREGGVTT